MKIIVFKDLQNNCILSVSSMEYYHGKKVNKTEADVEKAITEFNMTHPNQQYVTLECTEEVYEAICFILGERQYSKAHNLDDIFFRLSDIRDAVSNIRELTESMQSDLLTTMDDIDTKIQEIKKPKKR